MKTERSKDADYVNNIIAHYSANARNTGKLIAVLVIILSLLMQYDCKTSFELGFTYLGLEYLYCISITVLNKYILSEYFVPMEDGYVLKEGRNPSEISQQIANYGTAQMIANALILIASIICLI